MLTKIVDGVEVQCSAGEEAAIRAEWASAKQINTLVPLAKIALDKVTGPSGTIIRCVAAGVPVPAEWSAYVLALRNIVNGTDIVSTALPVQPQYPAGT